MLDLLLSAWMVFEQFGLKIGRVLSIALKKEL